MTRMQPSDAILAVDVGNSRVALAVWRDQRLGPVQRLPGPIRDDWRETLSAIWSETRGARRPVVVIASVNPAQARRLADLLAEVTGQDPLFIRQDVPLPLKMEVDHPGEIGVDRVCAAAAAFDQLQEACAVASFGTATTVDCVSADGRFLGGTILPGVQMSCDALHAGTARLPRIQPTAPRGPFGKNTYEAIAGGVAYMQVGALREIVERFATEMNAWPHLVITGGSAPLVAEIADFVDSHVPDLTLLGVVLAYRKASEAPANP